jgi:hypothetical protein
MPVPFPPHRRGAAVPPTLPDLAPEPPAWPGPDIAPDLPPLSDPYPARDPDLPQPGQTTPPIVA